MFDAHEVLIGQRLFPYWNGMKLLMYQKFSLHDLKRSNNFEISIVFERLQGKKINILTENSAPVLFVSASSFEKQWEIPAIFTVL